ncbi:hypothetical protein C4J96_4679 [Pseudomonas orientalis]|nr:hypothetical protein C4J96_4679 [Pseudomonas orientalis]
MDPLLIDPNPTLTITHQDGAGWRRPEYCHLVITRKDSI